MRRRGTSRGFTLIELVVSMVIAAVIAGFIGMFMATPLEAYFAQTRRGDLVDSADAIVRSFDQDISTALPNSVQVIRTGTVVAVALLATAGSARYWTAGETAVAPGGAARELDFSAADSQFATDGPFNASVHALPPKSFYLAVDNLGTAGLDAYTLTNVITPAGTLITFGAGLAGEDQITLAAPFQFAQASPTNTMYVVTQPVTYLCDEQAGTLTRYSGYAIVNPSLRKTAAQFAGTGASSSLVARFLSSCRFTAPVGTPYHGGVLGMQLTLVNNKNIPVGGSAETLQVFHQVAVQGIP